MKEIVPDTNLIAYCGLYCGSCKSYLKDVTKTPKHPGARSVPATSNMDTKVAQIAPNSQIRGIARNSIISFRSSLD
jgi:hypothetical protein